MKNVIIHETIQRKIKQRARRMCLNLQQLGLGEASPQSSQRVMQVIEECSISINKLLIISDSSVFLPARRLFPLLCDNYFDTISMEQLDSELQTLSLRERVAFLPERA